MRRPIAPARSAPMLAALLLLVAAGSAEARRDSPSRPPAAAFVEGRLAADGADLNLALARYGDALRADPGNLVLKRRALRTAVLAGDERMAFRLAQSLDATRRASGAAPAATPGDVLVALTAVTEAARVRDWDGWARARAGLVEPGSVETGAVIGLLLDAWEKAARGDSDGALALLEVPTTRGTARSYLAEHRAHLLGHAGRWPEAAGAYGQLIAGEGAGVPRLRLAAACAALKAGATDPAWRSRAIAWLGDGPARDPQLVAARALVAADPDRSANRLGGLVTRAPEGLALLFLRVAADLSRERGAGSSAVDFARLATFAAPQLPDGWLLLSDLLLRQDQPQLALAALDRVPRTAPWPVIAEPRRAAALAEAGNLEAARTLLAARAAAPAATAEDWGRLADLERRAEQHAAAASAYERALALAGTDEPAFMAQLRFLAGASHERAGNWPAAEPHLRAALALQPENPTVLNYLGYSLLDRRLRLDEAKTLIARAYALQPENGAIIDSMGWAEYIAGNHAAAVRLLEQARAAEPADPTVADHLGDALWRAGRRIEARHAWASARALDPDPKLMARLEEKLDVGLRPDQAMAASDPER